MNLSKMDKSDPLKMNQEAIRIADEFLQIPAFVDAEDLMNDPDEFLVTSYLSYFRNAILMKKVVQNLFVPKISKIPDIIVRETETKEEKFKRLWKSLVNLKFKVFYFNLFLESLDIKK